MLVNRKHVGRSGTGRSRSKCFHASLPFWGKPHHDREEHDAAGCFGAVGESGVRRRHLGENTELHRAQPLLAYAVLHGRCCVQMWSHAFACCSSTTVIKTREHTCHAWPYLWYMLVALRFMAASKRSSSDALAQIACFVALTRIRIPLQNQKESSKKMRY